MSDYIPEINKRLKQVVDYQSSGSVNKFSKLINVSQQKLNRVFSIDKRTGKYPTIPTEIFVKLTEYCDEINVTWILSGKGEMLISEKKNNSNPELELKPMDDLGFGLSDPSVYEKLARTQTQALEETLTELITLKNKLAEMTNKLITVNNTNKVLKERVQELEKALNKDQNIG